MAWYSTGTVTVTNNSATVTGNGTTWNVSIAAGDLFTVDGTKVYEISVVNSATSMTLAKPWTGSTASSQTYGVARLSTVAITTVTLANQVSELLTDWQVRENEYVAWHGGSATDGYRIDGTPANPAGSDQLAGYYPLTKLDGTTSYVACPAKLASTTSPTFTGTVTLPSTTSIGNVSNTEISYLDGVTSAIQTQLNNKQPLDATLTALAGVTTAADKLIYATGSDTFTTATLTSAARNLLDDTTTAAMLTTLGAAADNAVVKLTGDQTVAGIKTLTSKTNLSGGALLPNAEALDLAANNRPSIRPSLLLDFANSKTLDPRITYTRASTATYYDGKTFAKAEENLLLNSATLATQSVGCTATAYTLSFYGTGTVSLSGASTAGPLVGTGASDRVTLTFTPTAGSVTFTVSGTVTNAQLEQRSSVTAYTPTTTQPITNYIPQLMTAASGVPRFDHNPTTGESLGLLIEESRANLLTYSNDLTNAAWVKTNITAAKDRVSQDGTINACTLTATAANATILQSVTSASAARSTFARVRRITGSGTIEMTQDGGTTWTAISITTAWANYGPSSATVTNPSVGFRIATSGDVIAVDGVQLESGAFPTSYIKTEAAQVTRAADAASMTGTNFSSWYRQDQGSIYTEQRVFNVTRSNQAAATLNESINSYISIGHGAGGTTNRAAFYVVITSDQVYLPTASEYVTVGMDLKSAGTYKVNDFAVSFNGETVFTDTSGVLPVPTELRIGRSGSATIAYTNGTIRKLAYYPARLTNAELQGLTTP